MQKHIALVVIGAHDARSGPTRVAGACKRARRVAAKSIRVAVVPESVVTQLLKYDGLLLRGYRNFILTYLLTKDF